MKKSVCTLLTVLLTVAILLGGCSVGSSISTSDEAKTMTVTDSLGRTTTVPINAEKFAAIGPGCLRLYCYVGDIAKLVGIEQMEITWGIWGRPYIRANENLLKLPIEAMSLPSFTQTGYSGTGAPHR